MDNLERRSRIRANLGIEPISHGQVYTFQIAIPESEKQNISLERQQLIEDSLTQHKSNLIPLIVRRTEAYSEEEEYEIVYGADWCIVAKELEIEKLWTWVFDMTDEQAAAAKEEMQQLLGDSTNFESNINNNVSAETDIDKLLEQKLKPIYSKLNQIVSSISSNSEKSDLDEQLRRIETKFENLESVFEQLTKIVQETKIIEEIKTKKLDLVTASEEEIKNALEEAGVKKNERNAAWKAIKYWKESNKVLTWANLEKLSKYSSEHKKISGFSGFGWGTYQKLKNIADIHNK